MHAIQPHTSNPVRPIPAELRGQTALKKSLDYLRQIKDPGTVLDLIAQVSPQIRRRSPEFFAACLKVCKELLETPGIEEKQARRLNGSPGQYELVKACVDVAVWRCRLARYELEVAPGTDMSDSQTLKAKITEVLSTLDTNYLEHNNGWGDSKVSANYVYCRLLRGLTEQNAQLEFVQEIAKDKGCSDDEVLLACKVGFPQLREIEPDLKAAYIALARESGPEFRSAVGAQTRKWTKHDNTATLSIETKFTKWLLLESKNFRKLCAYNGGSAGSLSRFPLLAEILLDAARKANNQEFYEAFGNSSNSDKIPLRALVDAGGEKELLRPFNARCTGGEDLTNDQLYQLRKSVGNFLRDNADKIFIADELLEACTRDSSSYSEEVLSYLIVHGKIDPIVSLINEGASSFKFQNFGPVGCERGSFYGSPSKIDLRSFFAGLTTLDLQASYAAWCAQTLAERHGEVISPEDLWGLIARQIRAASNEPPIHIWQQAMNVVDEVAFGLVLAGQADAAIAMAFASPPIDISTNVKGSDGEDLPITTRNTIRDQKEASITTKLAHNLLKKGFPEKVISVASQPRFVATVKEPERQMFMRQAEEQLAHNRSFGEVPHHAYDRISEEILTELSAKNGISAKLDAAVSNKGRLTDRYGKVISFYASDRLIQALLGAGSFIKLEELAKWYNHQYKKDEIYAQMFKRLHQYAA